MDPDTARPTTKISQLISSDRIVHIQDSEDRMGIIERLIRLLCERSKLPDVEDLVELVLKREQGISTTLDTGLKIPHARVEGLKEFHCVLGVLPKGFKDDSGITVH